MTDRDPKGPAELVGSILTHVSSLVRKEFDLARAELAENVSRAGVAVGLLVAAVVIVLVALNVLAGALVAAITELGLAPGWSALIVGGVMALIAALMVVKALRDLKVVSLAPTRMAKNLRRDAEALKERV